MGMEPSFGPHGPELDQGDFLLNIPWGVVEAPLTVCRPEKTGRTEGRSVYGLEKNVTNAFRNDRREIIHATSGLTRAVVLWHGCQIDKFKKSKDPSKAFAAIAPVFVLEDRVPRAEDRQSIINGMHRSYFPLPPFSIDDVTVPETFVDLRHIWPVRQSLLLAESQRFASMGKQLRMALCEHLFTFFTRRKFLDSAPCPHCGGTIALSNLLEEEPEEV
jgi:hypothetical protein